ncbi:PAS domain-containing protein [Ferrovibrio sp.]|uniref:PAS domain-containing protein n=1 Tax=Ferrovibrio sp. TaxID=1917215 RepID=UPI00311D6693
MSSALLRRLAEADDSLLEGRTRDIDALMVERLYQSSWPVRYVPYPMLFGAFLVFRDYADWWSIIGLTALYTLGTWYLDRQRQRLAGMDGEIGEPEIWGRRFMLGSACTGLTWGILGALYFPAGDFRLQAVMAVAWAGLAFSSLNTRALHLPSYYAFLLPMSVPVYARTFLSGEKPAIYMALLGLVLGTAMTLAAHAGNRRERLGAALRLRNAELIGELDRARAAAESGRHDIEQAYRDILSENAAAQRIAGYGSWTWDAVADTMSWSDEFYRLVGLEPQACPAALAALLELVVPEDHEAVRRHVQRLRNGAGHDRIVFRLRRPDDRFGEAGCLREAIGESQTDGQGNVRHIFGVLRRPVQPATA